MPSTQFIAAIAIIPLAAADSSRVCTFFPALGAIRRGARGWQTFSVSERKKQRRNHKDGPLVRFPLHDMPSALDAIRFKIVTIERRARWIAEMEKDLNEFHNVSGLCTRSALVGLYYYLTTTLLLLLLLLSSHIIIDEIITLSFYYY